MSIIAYCQIDDCGRSCEHKLGAWICPVHRDKAVVNVVDAWSKQPLDPYDLPTGTYDPPGDSKLIFLAGAVTYWWNENWDTPERRAYHAWRQKARYALIEAGYITYAPHEAFKGSWNPKCQNVNNLAIAESNAFVILSHPDIPSNGTDDEMKLAMQVAVPVVWAPETRGTDYLLKVVGLACEVQETWFHRKTW